jgi:hypothetical protein
MWSMGSFGSLSLMKFLTAAIGAILAGNQRLITVDFCGLEA